MPHRSAFEAPNPLREGLRIKQSPEPCVMVIFGATGDLTHRKLLPALYNLALEHPLPAGFSVVGFARRPYTDEEFRQQALEPIKDELFSSILSQVPRSALPAAFAGKCRLFGREIHPERAFSFRCSPEAEHYPELADQLRRIQWRELPEGWDRDLPTFAPDPRGIATREVSGKVLNALAQNVPWLLGGSADLAPSTKTLLTFEGAGDFEANNYAGRNLHFGVREFAMGTVLNGLALAKVRAYGATFLIFSDYARAAIRLSALMEIPVIYIFTHDSIGVGEDGPTHQPVEQLVSLRAIPGLIVLRPADANEVVEAWRVIMQLHHEPAALVLSRQALPIVDRSIYAPASGVAQGAYILAEADGGKPEVLLLATGSEVALCLQAHEQLQKEGIKARVVSMPSWELFERQNQEYHDSVLPPDVTARVAVEQASTLGWAHYVGLKGTVIGMHTFGSSAPLKDLLVKFGFTPEKIVSAAKAQLASRE